MESTLYFLNHPTISSTLAMNFCASSAAPAYCKPWSIRGDGRNTNSTPWSLLLFLDITMTSIVYNKNTLPQDMQMISLLERMMKQTNKMIKRASKIEAAHSRELWREKAKESIKCAILENHF